MDKAILKVGKIRIVSAHTAISISILKKTVSRYVNYEFSSHIFQCSLE